MWFPFFSPIMEAKDDGKGASRQQLWAELFFILKHRMIFTEGLPLPFKGNNIEKDLFVICAVDTVRGCNHPIIANLQDFVSFSKRHQKYDEEKIL